MKSLRRHCLPCLSLFSATTSFAVEAGTAAAPSPATLGSAVFQWESLVAKPTATGLRRDLVDLPSATFRRFESHATTLNAGLMSHAPHRQPQEEFIILREGTLDVEINGRVQRVGPGAILFFASNDLHHVTNVGDRPATYLVFNFRTGLTPAADAPATATAAGTLPSTVFHWDKLAVRPTPEDARREIVNSPTVTCANFEGHITTLRAGETPHAGHHHPDEEIIVVKEGVMEATIAGVAQRGGPGSVFFYGSNTEHGMKNVGGTEATYYVFRLITDATPLPPAKPG